MTEKTDRNSVRKLLVDLHAARSFLDRVETQIRIIVGNEWSKIAQDARNDPSTAFEQSEWENTQADMQNATEPISRASDAISAVLTQDDLFRNAPKMAKKDEKQPILRKKGSITLSRKQVLDNLRRISAGKDLLDLADVNRILGFHKSTSGSFVRLAVRRGDLGAVPVGHEWKFLPIDVRDFVRHYFSRKAKGLEQ